ncbi:MAG TPA: hypothetical protein VMT30_06510 [Candidatus Saccharimonadia bacterium]|nr:hypothetical protein [Candidatus Saccharimonadia bacterium]
MITLLTLYIGISHTVAFFGLIQAAVSESGSKSVVERQHLY